MPGQDAKVVLKQGTCNQKPIRGIIGMSLAEHVTTRAELVSGHVPMAWSGISVPTIELIRLHMVRLVERPNVKAAASNCRPATGKAQLERRAELCHHLLREPA